MTYKIGKYPGVEKQVRTLDQLARLAGFHLAYVDALKKMVQHLQEDPLGWGDPLYRTHLEGGIVCHGLVGPIAVRYAIHEPEHTVFIMDIKPLFEWPIRP